MKKFLLICTALACTMTLQAADNTPAELKAKSEKRMEAARKGPRHATGSEKWLPGTIATYFWNYDEQDWNLYETEKRTYFANGLLETQESSSNKTTYTYNERGLESSVTYSFFDGEKYVNSSKSEYGYDSRIDVETEYKSFFWDEEENKWSLNGDDKNVITRNEAGNITKVEQYSSYSGEMTLGEVSEIKYGSDGKATEITNTDTDDNEIELQLKDIVWQNTNGQIFITDYNDLDAEDYFEGANRIKSATATVYDSFKEPVYITAEYPDNKGSYKVQLTYNGKLIYSMDYTVLDSYGSYSSEEYEVDFDYNEETGALTEDGESRYKEAATYDAYGIMTSYMSSSVSDDYSYTREEKNEVTYDSTYGYPTEVISMWLNEEGVWEHNSRKVYSDYKDFSSVAAIESADDAPVQYFNLNGMPVDGNKLAPGIYIRRQGNKATKLIVR